MKRIAAAAALMVGLPMAACSVSVDQDGRHEQSDVQIRTPVGNLMVRTGGVPPDTGLAVYPGSWPLRRHREGDAESADVTVGNSFFGVNVAAANFASVDSPDAIVNYYKTAMRAHGLVTECRGDIDFRGSGRNSRPVCRGSRFSRTRQLAVGTEERHRLVSVKARGTGSEYSVVFVQTRGT